MDAGSRAGADWVEIDVATSADGVPYVLHDNTVDRTTAGTGALNVLPSSVLDTLEAGEWFSPVHRGEPLPRFAAALDQSQRMAADLLLEIKGPETRAELERIIGMIRERGLIGRVLLQSFDEQVLRDSYAIEPALRLGLLRGDDRRRPGRGRARAARHRLQPGLERVVRPSAWSPSLNAAGIAVMPYTIDNPDVWLQARDAGVDGIITNKPGKLDGWNARYKQGGVPNPPQAVITSPVDGARCRAATSSSLGVRHVGLGRAATLDGRADRGRDDPRRRRSRSASTSCACRPARRAARRPTAESRFTVVPSAPASRLWSPSTAASRTSARAHARDGAVARRGSA